MLFGQLADGVFHCVAEFCKLNSTVADCEINSADSNAGQRIYIHATVLRVPVKKLRITSIIHILKR